MPATGKSTAHEIRFAYASPRQIIAHGEFVGSARWLTCVGEAKAFEKIPEPKRPSMTGGIDADGEDPAEVNSDLSALLAAITDDVQGRASAARDGIQRDFGGRIDHVRKHMSGFARAAAISAFAEARKAAIALVNQNAALELAGRRQAAIQMHSGKTRKAKREGGPNNSNAPTSNMPH